MSKNPYKEGIEAERARCLSIVASEASINADDPSTVLLLIRIRNLILSGAIIDDQAEGDRDRG
jgi:hypothetical protein